ncbi:MAG: sulfotransferase domain-containing protein [Rhodospirillaceae bacterium]|nr:sulfotransferase domain-containing protein [Rhodospirillaceae bacterium]
MIWRRLTASARLKPRFLIIGAQKSATGALFGHLLAHPLVLPPLAKEIHYFDFKYHRGAGWYLARFPLRRPGTFVTGEASPSYMLHPLAPGRAAAFDPDMKLIAILRDPVERALSHHAMAIRHGRDSLGFQAAVEAEQVRLRNFEAALDSAPENLRCSARRHSYLRRGRYAEQLQAWLAHFPRDNLLVLRTEDLWADGNRTLNRAFAFLGLPPHRLRIGTFTGQRRYAIDPALRKRLEKYFADDQARLKTLLDGDRGR